MITASFCSAPIFDSVTLLCMWPGPYMSCAHIYYYFVKDAINPCLQCCTVDPRASLRNICHIASIDSVLSCWACLCSSVLGNRNDGRLCSNMPMRHWYLRPSMASMTPRPSSSGHRFQNQHSIGAAPTSSCHSMTNQARIVIRGNSLA